MDKLDIVFISDTHGMENQLKDIPDGDVIVHTGDISNVGGYSEVEKFLKWFDNLPHKHKVYIAGNHDLSYEDNPEFKQEMIDLFPNLTYLENSSALIEGFKFYGSPITPRFHDWAFNVDRGTQIRDIWDEIPYDTDVLLTHGPPLGIGDTVPSYGINRVVGCFDLLDKIYDLPLKIHAFGHIHEGYGTYFSDASFNDTKFINASVVDKYYNVVNRPIMATIYK